jgi:hypothetical protein|tara:strand:+ start:35 stop:145 length:111 start_codon:yes stop_codon:yes gene_type:complete
MQALLERRNAQAASLEKAPRILEVPHVKVVVLENMD